MEREYREFLEKLQLLNEENKQVVRIAIENLINYPSDSKSLSD